MAKATAAQLTEALSAYEQAEQMLLIQKHYICRANSNASYLRARLAQSEAKVRAAPAPKAPRPARIVPQDELDRVANMALAKAKAIASGHSVVA